MRSIGRSAFSARILNHARSHAGGVAWTAITIDTNGGPKRVETMRELFPPCPNPVMAPRAGAMITAVAIEKGTGQVSSFAVSTPTPIE